MTETQTRQQEIDHRLAASGWHLTARNTVTEFFLDGFLPGSEDDETRGFADYVLLDDQENPLAIVEAKRSSRDAIAGQRQAQEYAELARQRFDQAPFLYLTNGREIWFWEWPHATLRRVESFHTREDLQRLRFLRQYRRSLASVPISTKIAGYQRPYQVEAVKRVTEAMENGQRKCLLVMATGTGKTRVAVAMVDVLLRARWAQRVLFLVDRRALGRQALGAFKEYLPQEPRTRIENAIVDPDARIHIATYPSMMQVYKNLSMGYYDLIIADESHRSIYNRYKILFEHFDALQLGLTATPTDFIEHNTFELFHCPDGLPTFYYPFETAVEEGYLVNYRILEAKTKFQITGIKTGILPPEVQRQLEQQGIDLGDIDFEGTDLEKRVSNTGTNDALVAEFMDKCRKDATGTLPAKSIFFAMSHAHAKVLWESFNRLYPNLQARGMAQIIDSHMERVEVLLDDFRMRDMPRVAISVDMLDTGIDIPAVQTLVFAKPIYSQVKFWQMIGRGTRLWIDPATGQPKEDFLIIDHWDNFAYFKMQPTGEREHISEPLPVRLFRARLQKLTLLPPGRERDTTEDQLVAMLAALPRDISAVRHNADELAFWTSGVGFSAPLTEEVLIILQHSLAPLLRFLSDVQLPVMLFELRAEQLAIAWLLGQTADLARLRAEIVKDLTRLPANLREVQAVDETRVWAVSEGFWQELDLARIRQVQEVFAPLMVFRQTAPSEMIVLNLPDTIAQRRWVVYGPGGEGAFASRYQEQVEAYVRTLAEELPALAKLRRSELLSDEERESLAAALNSPDLFISEETLREVYEQPEADLAALLRHIMGIQKLPGRELRIRVAFDRFLEENPRFTSTQVQFVRSVRHAVLQGARLTEADLRLPPFSRVGVVERLFEAAQVEELMTLAQRLAA